MEEIINEAPDFGKAYNHIGFIYETKYQDLAKAEEYYKYALRFTPNYYATYYNLAIVLSTLKKWEELEQLLANAQQLPGINQATLANEYAIMYESRREYDQAIEHYKNYANLSFDNKQFVSIERCKKKKDL